MGLQPEAKAVDEEMTKLTNAHVSYLKTDGLMVILIITFLKGMDGTLCFVKKATSFEAAFKKSLLVCSIP
jgi:hypothetical protein